jgi:anti-sigma28 factor (negative regulator of flagellin synthesis)
MEINNITGIGAYNKIKNGLDAPKGKPSKSAKNVDKAEFSSAAAQTGAISAAKSEIRKSVESPAAQAYIESLKNAIKTGNYNVSALSVAASILDE